MPETKVRSGQLGSTLSSKTIDNTNTINTDLTKLAIAGGTNGQVLSTNGSSVLSWATAGGGGGMQVQVDTITSTQSWTPPVWAKKFEVYLYGGGSGGGSGNRCATNQHRCGGAGGWGSMLVHAEFTNTQITTPLTVTIGAGGVGGASVTSDNTNGNNGTVGGISSFGTLLQTYPSGIGNGALVNATSASSQSAISFDSMFGPGSPTGTNSTGRNSAISSTIYSSAGYTSVRAGFVGQGGAGNNQNVITSTSTGDIDLWTPIVSGTSKTNGASNGNNGSDSVSFNFGWLTFYTATTGGSYATGQNTGRGGDALYIHGGSGGAGADNGFNSGRGGNGGTGICFIISHG